MSACLCYKHFTRNTRVVKVLDKIECSVISKCHSTYAIREQKKKKLLLTSQYIFFIVIFHIFVKCISLDYNCVPIILTNFCPFLRKITLFSFTSEKNIFLQIIEIAEIV